MPLLLSARLVHGVVVGLAVIEQSVRF